MAIISSVPRRATPSSACRGRQRRSRRGQSGLCLVPHGDEHDFGQPNFLAYFDFNGDGYVDNLDFAQFRLEMGKTMPYISPSFSVAAAWSNRRFRPTRCQTR